MRRWRVERRAALTQGGSAQTRQRRYPATRTPPFEAVKMRKWECAALYRALTIPAIAENRALPSRLRRRGTARAPARGTCIKGCPLRKVVEHATAGRAGAGPRRSGRRHGCPRLGRLSTGKTVPNRASRIEVAGTALLWKPALRHIPRPSGRHPGRFLPFPECHPRRLDPIRSTGAGALEKSFCTDRYKTVAKI
jgi:hypothetical protein